jgi:hypothetical protein
VTAAAVAFALVVTAWSAYENDWTTDEPKHLEWSQRLVDQGITERESQLHFNSKTPVSVLNVVSRRFARRVLGVRNPVLARLAARLPGLAWLGVVLGATFILALRCAGPIAAHLATQAAALDPNLIANSSIATVDTAYAAATLLTVLTSLGFARRPSPASGVALGLALGLAFSVKFTAFLLMPGLLLLPLAVEDGTQRLWGAPRAVAGGGLIAVAIALSFVCAAYFFKEVGVAFGDVAWRSRIFHKIAAAAPALALPLPRAFLTGLDICLNAERTKAFNVVVLGRLHPAGVPYYFMLTWLIKTPVLLLVALVAGLARVLRRGLLVSNPALRYVALHLAIGLVYFSFVFRMQIGIRFVLMCVPLAAILAAAGLAGTAGHRLFAPGLLAVLLTAAGENLFYLGNSIAFTNAAVWPKREVFRLLADSNVDYGQNYEKMGAFFEEWRGPNRYLDPVHILPGENVVSFNRASGSANFTKLAWLREHLSPRAHFRHTYLFFDVSPEAFEAFLTEARRFEPTPLAAELCPAERADQIALDPALSPSFSRKALPGQVDVVCVRASSGADLALRSHEGEVLFGRADERRSNWDRLRDGKEAWYRLDPGTHAFVAAEPRRFFGEWIVRGGPVSLGRRQMTMNNRGELRPLARSEAPEPP